MSEAHLFTPFSLGNLELPNRIVVAPMCQYSAENGCMTDWHTLHLGHLALSGAGLLTLEASAVEPEGRITYGDAGIWSDETEAAMGRVVESILRWSEIPVALQLAHAGRKASEEVPWKGRAQIAPGQDGGWQTVAPSAIPFLDGENSPAALDRADIERLRRSFAEAAKRAARLGMQCVQLHSAHGYLLHQFLSPLSNKRSDDYGGSLENRMRFPLEVFEAVREAFPAERPVTVRVSGTDWVEGGWDIEQTVFYAQALEARGCTAIDVSSGGLSPNQKVQEAPAIRCRWRGG
ncbi:NADH:flavin oxidoreductase/NADH oxidase [Fodinicurvata halophila]